MQCKISCPSCNSTNTIKKGKRKNKLQTLQRYACKNCKKAFTSQQIPNKTYPPYIILNSISCYNLGYTQQQASAIIERTHKIQVPQRTISDWLKQYRNICTYSRLRAEAAKLYKPKEVVFSHRLEHNQIYNFKYHRAKLQLLFTNPGSNNRFTNIAGLQDPIQSYLEKIPTKEFPHHLFHNIKLVDKEDNNNKYGKDEQRASHLKFNHLKITPLPKTNLANKLASLALNLAKTNKDRHQAVQNFMLINDSTTIAVEVPVYLEKEDVRYYVKVLKSNSAKELLNLCTPITGHIDLLQLRNNLIYILDYKPEADKAKPIQQLTAYALALASRTRLNLKTMKCAWFDQNNYYEFFPLNAVHSY